jgi:hypothetical protein
MPLFPPPLPKQPAWWRRSCGSAELIADGFCRRRYDRRRQLPGFYCDLFFRLWRELHPATPAQLRLPLAA